MNQIICLTGMPGSGKSLCARIFNKNGFTIIEMSSIVKDLMNQKKVEINNINLRNFSSSLRKKYGNEIVAKLVYKKIKALSKSKKTKILINGIRSLYEVKYFKKMFPGIILIAISSPERTRYKRIIARARHDDMHTFKEFQWRENKELSWGLKKAISNADIIIYNNSTKQTLHKNINIFIKKIKKYS